MVIKPRLLKSFVAWTVCCGTILSPLAQAQELLHRANPRSAATPVQPAQPHGSEITDAALTADGSLLGQVVDSSGQGISGMTVFARRDGREISVTRSGVDGNFTLLGLQGGMVQVCAGQTIGLYRTWTARTEPPAARQRILIVANPGVVRGQDGRGMLWWVTNPWVLAVGISAAIAVPIALTFDNPSSS